jgi:hypothetical protein
MDSESGDAVMIIWAISLALGLVVTLVVAALLWWLHREATRILAAVTGVWEAGQRVANNTVHIPLLYKTESSVVGILAAAGGILAAASAIETHAAGCPGCPQCMWPPRGGPA